MRATTARVGPHPLPSSLPSSSVFCCGIAHRLLAQLGTAQRVPVLCHCVLPAVVSRKSSFNIRAVKMEKGREAPAAGSAAVSWRCIRGPWYRCGEVLAELRGKFLLGQRWVVCCAAGRGLCSAKAASLPVQLSREGRGSPSPCTEPLTPVEREKNPVSTVLSVPVTTWRAALALPPSLSEEFAGSKTMLKLFTGQGFTTSQLIVSRTQKGT